MERIENTSAGQAETPAEAEANGAPDPTAAAIDAIPPELVAQSLGEYFRAWFARVRGGDAGVLPVAFALVILAIAFQLANSNFLSAGNLVNLFIQSAVFIVLAMAEAFVLLLGEIDLSVGYVGAIGGIIAAQLAQPNPGLPWWLAIAAGLVACGAIGLLQGTIITRLRLPSFVVTLAGFLFWFGVMIILLGTAGAVPIQGQPRADLQVLNAVVNNALPPLVGWLGLAAIVVVLGAVVWLRDSSRRSRGLVAPPPSLTAMKIAIVALGGIAVVAISNVNRSPFGVVEGVPYVVPIVLVVLVVWSVLLERTPFGRHVYAVGGNPEAARRAGIDVARVRTAAFVLCSFTGAIAGIIYGSWQGGLNTNINGGQLVLYAVAAAVIGGTSLFGGRGRMLHGLLGGLVIGTIYNGTYLLGFSVQQQYMVTGLVLLAAVTIDALSRRGALAGA